MVQLVPNWNTQSNLPQWAENRDQLRSHCSENGVISKDAIKKCIQSVVETSYKRKDIEKFACNLVQAIDVQEISDDFDAVTKRVKELILKTIGSPNQEWIQIQRGYLFRKLEQILRALESFLELTGITDLLKPADQRGHGPKDIESRKSHLQFATSVVGAFSTFAAALGSVNGAIATAGAVAVLVSIGISYPFWKPFPVGVMGAENWTQRLEKRALSVGFERTKAVEELAELVKARIPTMLVGNPGVGKTELLKTFATAIARGDYPELSGSQVIHINTSEIPSMKDSIPVSRSPLYYLADRFEGHQEKAVMIFDAIHRANEKDPYTRTTDQFGNLLDNQSFPHLIAVTTPKEFEILNNEAEDFVNRFAVIFLKKPTEDEAIGIIWNKIQKFFPDALVDEKVPEMIAKSPAGMRNVDHILRMCVNKISLHQSKKDLQSLFNEKQELLEVRDLLRQTASNSQLESQNQALYFLYEELLPAMEERLKKKANEAGVKLWIDETLVEDVSRKLSFQTA